MLLAGISQWSAGGGTPLRISSPGVRDEIIADRFGIRGTEFKGSMPTRSLPVRIESAPENTKSFALTLIDYDAVEAVGVCWLHWLLCNFTETELPENASVERHDRLTQGLNTWGSPLLGPGKLSAGDASAYGGMAPPDRPHRYILTVYALNSLLDLKNGFTLNRLLAETGPRLLAATTLAATYRN